MWRLIILNNMDVETLRILIDRYENEGDLNKRMLLANSMIDIIKKEVWALARKIRESQGLIGK